MQRSEVTEAVAAYLEWTDTKRRLRPTTLATFRSQLKLGFERMPDPWTPEDLLPAIEHRLGPKATASTRRNTWDALTAFFKWWERNGGPANPLADARAPRKSSVRREALTADEVSLLEARMVQAHPRDRAMVALMLGAGCRIGDLIVMRVADIDLEGGRIRLRDGKGGTDSRLPIAPAVVSAIRAWLDWAAATRHHWGRGRPRSSADRLFPGRAADRALTAQAIEATFSRVAGPDLAGRCPHQLRHTFLTRLADEGKPVHVIQALARHSSLATTGAYLHASPDQLRQAVGQLDPEPTPQPPGALPPRPLAGREGTILPAAAGAPSATAAIAFTVAGSPPLYVLADEPIGALAAELQEVLRENPDAAPLTLPTLLAEWLSDDFRGLTTSKPATSALRDLVVDAASQTVSVVTSMGETVRSWSWDAFSSLDWYGDDRPGELIEPGWTARMMAPDSQPDLEQPDLEQPDLEPPEPGPQSLPGPRLRVLSDL